jgi:signal transduction histidine kinase
MSLRLRLIALTVALVTVVVLALSFLYLNSLVDSLSAMALERSEFASQQVNTFITDRINSDRVGRGGTGPIPTIEDTKTVWGAIVADDPAISAMLVRTMALSPALVEINVAGQDGVVLASSNPSRVGQPLKPLANFADWRSRPLRRRLAELIVRNPDYQVVAPLGVAVGESGQQPVFTTQVATSSVLLRAAVLPPLETVGAVSAGALLVSLLITGLATSRALRPLRRIEQTIDRIAQGRFGAEDSPPPRDQDENSNHTEPREFAAVESKLNLLGRQYTGARQDATNLKHSLDEMVDRMATQFDLASRFAAISRISGGVAHEIKNPLNAISLHLDLLRARAESTGEELLPEIDVLSKEVRRLDRVVKTFLDFSRPVEVRFVDVDLGALAAEVTHLMTPQAQLAGIELHCESPAQPVWVRGDEDMLQQAVLNLVTNAMEAMKTGGHLGLTVASDRHTVTLTVADDGPGIPAEMRGKVFQLYFTTKEKGSGIGLAMTYRAVQLHNGTVDFVSEVGRGTTFRLQLPSLVQNNLI